MIYIYWLSSFPVQRSVIQESKENEKVVALEQKTQRLTQEVSRLQAQNQQINEQALESTKQISLLEVELSSYMFLFDICYKGVCMFVYRLNYHHPKMKLLLLKERHKS